MQKQKLYISAAIFMLLTCIKLLLPEAVETMRSGIAEQIDRNIDYKAVVATLAQKVDDYSRYFEQDAAVLRPSIQPQPTTELKQLDTQPEPTPTAEPEPSPTPVPAPSLEPEVEEMGLPFVYTSPLTAVTVSSGFGSRLHPIDGVEKFHYGLDMAASSGDTIRAFADGEVTTAEYSDSYGNYIVLRHDETYSSLYAHCSQLLVSAGDYVSAGQEIALVGQTGAATGPHLHFELQRAGEHIDPGEYLC